MKTEEVQQTILNSINSLALIMDKPNVLAPKGSLSGKINLSYGIAEYDPSLMPKPPELIELNKYLDSLINAYNALTDKEK